jgi:hypothetical protein
MSPGPSGGPALVARSATPAKGLLGSAPAFTNALAKRRERVRLENLTAVRVDVVPRRLSVKQRGWWSSSPTTKTRAWQVHAGVCGHIRQMCFDLARAVPFARTPSDTMAFVPASTSPTPNLALCERLTAARRPLAYPRACVASSRAASASYEPAGFPRGCHTEAATTALHLLASDPRHSVPGGIRGLRERALDAIGSGRND